MLSVCFFLSNRINLLLIQIILYRYLSVKLDFIFPQNNFSFILVIKLSSNYHKNIVNENFIVFRISCAIIKLLSEFYNPYVN